MLGEPFVGAFADTLGTETLGHTVCVCVCMGCGVCVSLCVCVCKRHVTCVCVYTRGEGL